MHWLDTSALLIVAGTAVVGAAVGLVRPAVWLATLAGAAVVSALLSPVVAGVVGGANGAPAPPALFAGLVFVAALVAITVVVAMVKRAVWQSMPAGVLDAAASLGWLNRLLGAAAGAVLAAVPVGLAACAADQADEPRLRARVEGSATLRHARPHLGATAKSLAAAQKERLGGAVEWLKRKADEEKARQQQAPTPAGLHPPVPPEKAAPPPPGNPPEKVAPAPFDDEKTPESKTN